MPIFGDAILLIGREEGQNDVCDEAEVDEELEDDEARRGDIVEGHSHRHRYARINQQEGDPKIPTGFPTTIRHDQILGVLGLDQFHRLNVHHRFGNIELPLHFDLLAGFVEQLYQLDAASAFGIKAFPEMQDAFGFLLSR